jgi:protein-tyrosine phosphatase
VNKIDYDGSGELYISGIVAVREEPTSHLDSVITVCQDSVEDNISDEQNYAQFCMADGPHNSYGGDHSYEMFAAAADTLYEALASGDSVLIHCHIGQSRSVSVAVAALGRLLDIPRHEAYDIVKNYRPQAHPDKLLMGHASTYIEHHTDTESLWSQYENEDETR